MNHSEEYGDKISKIKAVLRKYFEVDDSGVDNDEYDPDFSAQEAVDEIHEIVGII